MKLHQYLDSTYLKTSEQAGISEEETQINVIKLVKEAIEYGFKLVMIRSNYISLAKSLIEKKSSSVLVGTVIGFHEGNYPLSQKLEEAQKAVNLGVDELDFVLNYEAFKQGNLHLVEQEIIQGTSLGLTHNKIVKWIIEVAALSDEEIASVSELISKVVVSNFGVENAKNVFVKSSTGFYKTADNKPNGATFDTIKLMIEHAKPLPVKAAGGVSSFDDAVKMIELGVTRIGTSSALKIITHKTSNTGY